MATMDLGQAAKWFRTAADAFDAVDGARQEFARVERLRGESETTTQGLQADNLGLTKQRDQLRAEVGALRGEFSDLTAAISAKRDEHATLLAAIAQLTDELAALRSRVGIPA